MRNAHVEDTNVAVSILRLEVASRVSYGLCLGCAEGVMLGLGTSQMKPAKQERLTGIKVQVHS